MLSTKHPRSSTVQEEWLTNEGRHHLLLLYKGAHDKRGTAESLHAYINRAQSTVSVSEPILREISQLFEITLTSLSLRSHLGCTLEINSLTTVGYLLEVFIKLWNLPWSIFSLLLRASTGNLSQGFFDTFSVSSRPWTHPLISERSIVRARRPEYALLD